MTRWKNDGLVMTERGLYRCHSRGNPPCEGGLPFARRRERGPGWGGSPVGLRRLRTFRLALAPGHERVHRFVLPAVRGTVIDGEPGGAAGLVAGPARGVGPVASRHLADPRSSELLSVF